MYAGTLAQYDNRKKKRCSGAFRRYFVRNIFISRDNHGDPVSLDRQHGYIYGTGVYPYLYHCRGNAQGTCAFIK